MDQWQTLRARWQALKSAERAMVAAPGPLGWPGDPLRDRVQGLGMAFGDEWHRCADAVRAVVAANPEVWPELHVPDKRGGKLPDPTVYAYAAVVLGRLDRAA